MKKARKVKKGGEDFHPIDDLIKALSNKSNPLSKREEKTVVQLVCLKCHSRNPEEANFCSKCGQRLK